MKQLSENDDFKIWNRTYKSIQYSVALYIEMKAQIEIKDKIEVFTWVGLSRKIWNSLDEDTKKRTL